jgi:hypothetical protein
MKSQDISKIPALWPLTNLEMIQTEKHNANIDSGFEICMGVFFEACYYKYTGAVSQGALKVEWKCIMGGFVKELMKGVSRNKEGLASIARTAGLTLANDVLTKPGIGAYLEYQIERIFRGWSESSNCPEEVSLTADAIVRLFSSRGLLPNRIAVDGIPGSGKSTLAAALARKLDMAVECLDHKNMDQAISFAQDRTIYEHHRLLRTQSLDSFDALIYIDEPVEISRQNVLQRKRGGYLVDIMNYDRLKAIGDKAFSVAAGECIAVEESFVRVKIRPEGGFRCLENIEAGLVAKGLSSKGLKKEQALFLCVEGKARKGFGAYLNPHAYDKELLLALRQGLFPTRNPRRGRW